MMILVLSLLLPHIQISDSYVDDALNNLMFGIDNGAPCLNEIDACPTSNTGSLYRPSGNDIGFILHHVVSSRKCL
jgi:hypothetical protein